MHKKQRFRFRRITIYLTLLIASGFFIVNLLSKFVFMPVILLYHSVVPTVQKGDKLAVTVNFFERQMRFLKKFKYNVISLENLSELIRENKILPKTVVMTLDDGFKDNYTYAFPILKKYNFPATIFLIVNEVGQADDRLNWEEVRIMQDSGLIDFGSHTRSHLYLTALKREKLENEIVESRRIMEEKLKQPVHTFSYPYGDINARVESLIHDLGFKVAVGVWPERRYAADDLHALRRIPINYISENLFIFWLQCSGYFSFLLREEDKVDCRDADYCR